MLDQLFEVDREIIANGRCGGGDDSGKGGHL
jgi:hypothetical protein